MQIKTVAHIAKGVSMKREKIDDVENVVAHLKFSDLFMTQEQVDELTSRPPGWCRRALFDELGAPVFHMNVQLPKLELSVVGTVGDAQQPDRLHLLQATLSDIVLSMTTLGAAVQGTLTWLVAGDEASDCEPLLGRVCAVSWQITNRQGDLLAVAA
jgi:hypothetical protein